MTAFTIRISDELDKELTIIATQEDRSKSYLAREAIKNYIRELREDKEDAEIALKRMKEANRKFYTSEELLQRLQQKRKHI